MKSFLRSLSIDSRRTVVRESLGSEYWLTAYAVKKVRRFYGKIPNI